MKNKSKNSPSDRQLAANRANAAKSTGPRTPEGKEKSSRNAITHGITVIKPVLTSEEEPVYDNTAKLLRRDFDPHCATEELIFLDILEVKWTQRRLRLIEHAQLELSITHPDTLAQFSILEGIGLTSAAYRALAEKSPVMHLINRQLSRLSREHRRLMREYCEIHGPIIPAPPIEASEPETQAEQNEANPNIEHDNEPTRPRTVAQLIQIPRQAAHDTQQPVPAGPRLLSLVATVSN